MTNKVKGAMWLIFSALSFSVMTSLVRLAGELPTAEKVLFRNAIAAVVTLVIMLRKHVYPTIPRSGRSYVALRAIAGTIGIFCNFYAIDHLNLADANMLNKLSPFFAVAFSALLLRERPKPLQIVAILAAFAGSLLIIKPTGTNMLLVPSLLGALGGIAAGLAATAVRGASGRGVNQYVIVLAFSLTSCLTALPFMLTDYIPLTTRQLIIMLGCGVFGAGGQVGFTRAYSYAPAKDISVFDYTQVLFAAILGYFLFKQIPDVFSFIGYFIIISMAVLIFIYGKRSEKAKLSH